MNLFFYTCIILYIFYDAHFVPSFLCWINVAFLSQTSGSITIITNIVIITIIMYLLYLIIIFFLTHAGTIPFLLLSFSFILFTIGLMSGVASFGLLQVFINQSTLQEILNWTLYWIYEGRLFSFQCLCLGTSCSVFLKYESVILSPMIVLTNISPNLPTAALTFKMMI